MLFVHVPAPVLPAARQLSGPAVRTPTDLDSLCPYECVADLSRCCRAPKCCRDVGPVYDLSGEVAPTAALAGALYVPVAPSLHPRKPQGGEWAAERND